MAWSDHRESRGSHWTQIMAFYPFFAHITICHRLFHLLWPFLLHWHFPSASFLFSSLSSSSPAFSQPSHLFCPFPISASLLWFLPNMKYNLALLISSPTQLLQSNIHLLPFTEAAPIPLFINLFPAKLQAYAGCTDGSDLPAPSMWSLVYFSLWDLVPLDFYSSPSWPSSHLSGHLLGVLLRILLISSLTACGTVRDPSLRGFFPLSLSLGSSSTNTPSVLMTHKSTSVFQYVSLSVRTEILTCPSGFSS